jgi:hypothetical protein
MPAPSAVRYATAAVWAILALAVLRTILTVVFKDDLIDAWIDDRPSARVLPREFLADEAPRYVGAALFSLGVAVPLALAAVALPKGARWARIVAIIFALLCLLGVALAFLAPSLPILWIINVLVALGSIAAVVGLFTSDSRRFFAGARPVR